MHGLGEIVEAVTPERYITGKIIGMYYRNGLWLFEIEDCSYLFLNDEIYEKL